MLDFLCILATIEIYFESIGSPTKFILRTCFYLFHSEIKNDDGKIENDAADSDDC